MIHSTLDGPSRGVQTGRLRSWTLRLAAAACFLITLFSLALAEVVPGRWEKVDGLADGTPVRVFLHSGDWLEGIYQSSTPREIELLMAGARLKTVPKAAIRRMETRYKVDDPVANGIAIGAGVGLALGGLGLAQGNGAGDFSPAGTLVFLGLIGGGLGYAVDKAKRRPAVLYFSR